MEVAEIYNGIARAVETAKPAQEYCFLWIPHWSTCMTKAEWSGWVQAMAVTVTIGVPFIFGIMGKFRKRKILIDRLSGFIKSVHHVVKSVENNDLVMSRNKSVKQSMFEFRRVIINMINSEDHVKKISASFGDDYYSEVVDFFRAVNMAEGDVGKFLGEPGKNQSAAFVDENLSENEVFVVYREMMDNYLKILEQKLQQLKNAPFGVLGM